RQPPGPPPPPAPAKTLPGPASATPPPPPPTEVHFKQGERAPLLLVGATEDHTVPASLTKEQYEKYEHSPAQTDYLEFEGRPHLHMVADDWEEGAAAVDSSLAGVTGAPHAAPRQTSAWTHSPFSATRKE